MLGTLEWFLQLLGGLQVGRVQTYFWSIRPACAGLRAVLLIFILSPVLRKLKESSIFSCL